MTIRPSSRTADQLRALSIEPHVSNHAEGSCLVKFGNTHVRCTASVDESVPHFMRNSGKGWVTAEYGMLPRATNSRMSREAARGKQSGRTQEIQRLIGRSLRAIIDLDALGERQITIDCDVIEADGGTRTASITGGFVALAIAIDGLVASGKLSSSPIKHQLAAVSCGIYKGNAVLDVDYIEDSAAEMDANFVLTAEGNIVEVQCTAEEYPISQEQYAELFALAQKGIKEIAEVQQVAIKKIR